MKRVFGITIILACAQAAFTQEDYSQWLYLKTFTVNTANTGGGANVSTPQLKFPLLLRLTAANFDGFSKAASNGSDIRFTKPNGTTRLPHQIERWDAAGRVAEIWVLTDTLPGNGSAPFRMYWGKTGAPDSSNGNAVFDTANGYAGVWHLNGISGSVLDATTNAANGTSNGSSSSAGFIANARGFDGIGNYITLGNPTALNFSGKITCESWVFWTASDGSRNILDHGQAAGSDPEVYLRLNGGNYEAGSWNGTDHRAVFSAAGDSAVWVRLAGVYDGSKWILYRNGVALASTTDATGALQNPSQNWSLGATGSGASRFYKGVIDEPRISKVARGADWIKLEYACELANQTAVTFGATQNTPPSSLQYPVQTANYTVGVPIANNTPTVSGVITGYTVLPTLPTGLSLDSVTGVLSGTPTQARTSAQYVVTARNAAGSVNDTLTLTVSPSITAPDSLTYKVNPVVYTVGVSALPDTPSVKGNVTSYSVNPDLPAGLTLDATTGILQGTPTWATPAANYAITANNIVGSTSAVLNLTVTSVVTVPSPTLAADCRFRLAGIALYAFHVPPDSKRLRLEIVGPGGGKVWMRSLVPNRMPPELDWNGMGDNGQALSRGVYFLRVLSYNGTRVRAIANRKITWTR